MQYSLPPSTRRGFLGLLAGLVGAPVNASDVRPAGCQGIGPSDSADDRAAWLRQWAALPRIPVLESNDRFLATLLDHARLGRPLALFYHGGSTPGRLRRFTPELVFRHDGCPWIYLSGFCHQQQAPRILRLDRIERA